jgi:hypothetical protein
MRQARYEVCRRLVLLSIADHPIPEIDSKLHRDP